MSELVAFNFSLGFGPSLLKDPWVGRPPPLGGLGLLEDSIDKEGLKLILCRSRALVVIEFNFYLSGAQLAAMVEILKKLNKKNV